MRTELGSLVGDGGRCSLFLFDVSSLLFLSDAKLSQTDIAGFRIFGLFEGKNPIGLLNFPLMEPSLVESKTYAELQLVFCEILLSHCGCIEIRDVGVNPLCRDVELWRV